MENGKDKAFPSEWDGGMSKREYFAAMAMSGLCANPNPNLTKEGMNGAADWYANCAVQFADELLKALENTP